MEGDKAMLDVVLSKLNDIVERVTRVETKLWYSTIGFEGKDADVRRNYNTITQDGHRYF